MTPVERFIAYDIRYKVWFVDLAWEASGYVRAMAGIGGEVERERIARSVRIGELSPM